MTGRIQNDNYTNKNGEKVYSVQIIAEEIEFAESKASSDSYHGGNFGGPASAPSAPTASGSGSADGFMNIPDGLEEELPFS